MKIKLPKNALEVFINRYSLRDENGKSVESVEEIFERVVRVVAEAENRYRDGIDPAQVRKDFYDNLCQLRFLPNGRTIANAGTGSGQLANCFVLPIADDLGKMDESIFATLRNAVMILQSGGGVGFSFGRLRHKGALISTSKGKATGAVSFLKIYDTAFWVIGQGGGRRSACMAVLPVHHPDILDFIKCKENEGEIEHFNISVAITDEFMEAVEKDKLFNLIDPSNKEIVKKIKARTIFDMIATYAHHNGEPGLLFIDEANRDNPVPEQYTLEATNPCFTGDTRVATQYGLLRLDELEKIAEELNIATDNRVTRNEVGISILESSKVFKTGYKKVFEIKTKKGYRVKATADHKFLTDKGFMALSQLKIRDKILLQSGEGNWTQKNSINFIFENNLSFSQTSDNLTRLKNRYANLPKKWTRQLGVVLGYLIGDGWISPKSNSPLGFSFGKNKDGEEGLNLVKKIMEKYFTSGSLSGRDRAWQLTFGKTPTVFFEKLGVNNLKAIDKRVPEAIFRAPREAVVGFLQGLFSADGTVEYSVQKQSCTVRLASSSKQLLEDIQLLLVNFGIISSIKLRREKGEKYLPDSSGGKKLYQTNIQYELIIGKQNRDIFSEKIGFSLKSKQDKLENFINSKKRKTNYEPYDDEIIKIKNMGEDDVYDLTQMETHSLIANGLVAHNCGEQWLGPGENCCMASVNLACHVKAKSEKRKMKNEYFNCEVDWDKLRKTVEVTTRFLDDVIDANKYVPAVPLLQEAAFKNRRIGLSIMGLADMMFQLGISYGSLEGEKMAEELMEFIRFHTLSYSVELARQRGAFPGISQSIYNKNDFKFQINKAKYSQLNLDWKGLVKDIKKFGIRNAAHNTIAPTGAIATIAGLEGYGCEPVFSLSYVMKTHEGADFASGQQYKQFYYESNLLKEKLKEIGFSKDKIEKVFEKVRINGSCQQVAEIPESVRKVFVVSGDLEADQHIKMQAALQRFVDNSISKTINFPDTATVEDIKKAYLQAWKAKCKGLTIYVTGSRDEVIFETRNEKATSNEQRATKKENPYQTNGYKDLRGKPLIKELTSTQSLVNLKTCPECGSPMQKAEGCVTCPECGWSKCDV